MKLRDAMDVQKAHDTLRAAVVGEVHIDITAQQTMMLHVALDVLCWVLDHEHNTCFADNLQSLRDAIRDAGYEEKRIQ